jgi:hypothetical protein
MKKILYSTIAKVVRRVFDVYAAPCPGVVYFPRQTEQQCDRCNSDFKNTDHRHAEYACIFDYEGKCCLLQHAKRKCTKEMKILKPLIDLDV